MGAQGVIASYRKLKDVSFERTDGSPAEDLDSPIYYTSASKLYMGPVSGGGPPGSGSFSLGVSTGGNTLGQTGITGTRVVLAGGGEITLSQLTDAGGATITVSAPSQSVQTQNRFNLTLAGNTAGALQEVSSGTLTLAGGANVTLSQNGNAITISAGGGAETQTFVAGVGNSETTYTSGTVRLSELGAVTIRSTTGQQLQISVAPQSVQPETQTFLGGVAASNTTYTSGTVSIVGAGDITVQSGTGQRVIISGSQSVQPETQTFIGGISASDTLYTSGTVRFTGVGGGVTVSSNTGQRIDISVAAPVAQTGTQFSAGISGGNTAGQTGTVAGRLVLAGGNRITLSGATNGASATVTISAPNAQTGISSIAASNATYTSGQVEFTGSGIVTIRSSAGQRVVVDASQSVQTQERFDLTISGNTSGAGALVSSGTLTLAGGNNITLSQAGNAITISGANVGGAQTGISGIANSQTTYTSGTVSLSELGAITIRSTTGNQFQLSVNPQSVQPETQTFVGGIAGSDTTYTSGTVRFTGVGGGITVSSNTGQRIDLSVAAPVNFSGGISGGNTSGDTGATGTRLVFAGGNNVTLSGATDAQGGTITISGANIGGAQTGISGLANSETTYTSGTVSLSELGAITIRSTTGNQFQLSVDSQSNQTLGMFALGNTTGQSSSTTRDARSLSFAGDGAVSVGFSAGSLRISAPVQTGTQFSAGLTNVGNTAGDTGTVAGRLVLVGTNNITLSGSTNGASQTVSIVGPNTNPSFSAGVSNLGNSAGDTGVTGTRLVLVGSNNVSLSQATGAAGATVSFFAPTPTGGSSDAITKDIAQTGHGLSVGDWVRLDGSDYVLAQADAAVNAEVVGVVSAVADTDNFTLTQEGYVSGLTGLTAGSVHWLSDTNAGEITDTEPTTEGVISKPVLLADSTTSGWVTTLRGAEIHTTSPTGFSAGVSTLGNTLGDTGLTGSQLVLAGINNITLSQVTNASGARISISGPNTQPSFSAGVSNVGNTAGNTGVTGTRLVLAGAGAVTLSQDTAAAGGTVTISAPAQTVESQSFGMSNIGNTSGTTGIASGGQVRFLLAGGNGITLSQSLNGASGTITISGVTQSVESQSIGMSNVGNTSGTTGMASGGQVRFVLAGGNNITLSQSLNGASGTITISAPNAVAQTVQTLGMYAVQNTTGQSSSTTVDARTLSIAGDGAVSVGYSAGSLRISAPVQTVESQSIGMSNLGNTSGTTGVASGGQVRFLIVGGNNVTLSQSLNGASGTLTISAFNQTGTQFSAGISGGNTAGDTGTVAGRVVLAGGANITLSGSTNGASETISIVGGGGGGFSAGVSDQGNTAGATGVTGTRLVLVGTNNITLSQTTGAAGATISISGQSPAGGAFSGGASTGGNTAGATGITGTQLVLVGTGPISLSQTTGANGGTLSIDAPATSSLVGTSGVSVSTNGSTISVYLPNRTQFYPFNDIPIVTGQQGQATLHIAPIHFPNIQHDRLLLGMQMSNASNSSNSITVSAWAGIYSRNASSISLISSISTSTNFTGSGTVGSYSLYGGPKWLSIPWTNTITEDDYWFGIVIRTTTGGGAGHTVSQLCVSKFTNSAWSGLVGAGSNATDQYQLGLGVYTASTSGMPASIAFTQIQGSGSMALREPIFQLRSGTV